MTTDLEDAVMQFLGSIPKKRYVSVREIWLGITGGIYPTAQDERAVKRICLSLWEQHRADEKTIRRPYYRLREKKKGNVKMVGSS